MFIIGRFLTGIATGSFCIIVPMYTAEIAGKDIRGSLGTYFQLQITIGILLIYVFGSFVSVFHQLELVQKTNHLFHSFSI